MNDILASAITTAIITPVGDRERLAVRIFRFAVAVNLALTVFALVAAFTGFGNRIAGQYLFNSEAAGRFLVLAHRVQRHLGAHLVRREEPASDEVRGNVARRSPPGVLVAHVATLQPRRFAGAYPERRIRITDMIGRRGRFITLAMAGFDFLVRGYLGEAFGQLRPSAFGPETVFDAMLTNWLFIALFYVNGFLGAMFYGAQTRVMDGMLGRANCLLILTFWALFKFALIPYSADSCRSWYAPEHFALLFAFIWGNLPGRRYALRGRGLAVRHHENQVCGVGDVNRKSIAGTVTGLVGGIVFGVGIVLLNHLPGPFIAFAVTVAVTSSLLELYLPRGTDDFTMATGNALVCWAFGLWVMN